MNKLLTGIAAAFVILVIGFSFSQRNVDRSFGSVAIGGESQATTTGTTWNAAALITGGSKLLACGTNSVLNNIVIEDATAGSLTLYDATTTVNGAIYGTTTLARITASQVEGTYVYDRGAIKYGILAEFQSPNVASTTITFKGNPVCQ